MARGPGDNARSRGRSIARRPDDVARSRGRSIGRAHDGAFRRRSPTTASEDDDHCGPRSTTTGAEDDGRGRSTTKVGPSGKGLFARSKSMRPLRHREEKVGLHECFQCTRMISTMFNSCT